MDDPKLVRSRVVISYRADDDFRSEEAYASGKGVPLFGGVASEPQAALLQGLQELARLTALFGFEDEALKAFNEARARVADWKAKRPKARAA